MIHYSCDRCRRLIETDDEIRYVIRFEVRATFSDDDPSDVASNHLFEMDSLLDSGDSTAEEVSEDEVCTQRFDLCSECYAAFRMNPLGRETSKPVGFSDN